MLAPAVLAHMALCEIERTLLARACAFPKNRTCGTLCTCRERDGKMTSNLELVGQQAIEYLEEKHAARERALPRSRSAIRHCANSIRATHRHEFSSARQ